MMPRLHDATNSMMAGAGVCLLAVCLPKLAIADINSAGMMAGAGSWRLSHLPHLAIYKQPPRLPICLMIWIKNHTHAGAVKKFGRLVQMTAHPRKFLSPQN